MLALGAVLVVRARQYQTNRNAYAESLSRLAAQDRAKMEALIHLETSGMTRNEERGIVYYQGAAKTGSANRIYLLWLLAEGSDAEAMLESVRETAEGGAIAATAVYVDLGFHSFRTKYAMSLARMLKDRGLDAVRGSVYAWNAADSNWRATGRVDGTEVEHLLTPELRRELLQGTFNVVAARGTGDGR